MYKISGVFIGFTRCLVVMACLVGASEVFPYTWAVPITVKGDSVSWVLTFATDPNGTDGYDYGLDSLQPPPGPTGFWAGFMLQGIFAKLKVDVRSSADTLITWELLTANANGIDDSLFWSPGDLPPSGKFTLGDTIDMRQDSIAVYTGDLHLPIVFSASVGISEGKNLTGLHRGFALYQNYPNPFSKYTIIRFQIQDSRLHSARIQIYDIAGRVVKSFPITNNQLPVLFGMGEMKME